jgi:hypothetical protein
VNTAVCIASENVKWIWVEIAFGIDMSMISMNDFDYVDWRICEMCDYRFVTLRLKLNCKISSYLSQESEQKKNQILAQQPFLVEASSFEISRHIYFFYEVGFSDQCPQPLLHERKTMTYLGFEPRTFGYQAGYATNWTTEVVHESEQCG